MTNPPTTPEMTHGGWFVHQLLCGKKIIALTAHMFKDPKCPRGKMSAEAASDACLPPYIPRLPALTASLKLVDELTIRLQRNYNPWTLLKACAETMILVTKGLAGVERQRCR